jgi:hypothetical protein
MTTVVLPESADFILLPLNARVCANSFFGGFNNFVVDEIPTEQ